MSTTEPQVHVQKECIETSTCAYLKYAGLYMCINEKSRVRGLSLSLSLVCVSPRTCSKERCIDKSRGWHTAVTNSRKTTASFNSVSSKTSLRLQTEARFWRVKYVSFLHESSSFRG